MRSDRRALLAGGAMAAAGLAQARAEPALAFDTPARNVRTMARLQGDLGGGVGHVRYTGRSFALMPDGATRPLFDIDGTSAVRVIAQPGGVYQFLFTEFAVYLDLVTGAPLERWTNPLTGETVGVWALRNGPVNYALDPAKATLGSFARLGGGVPPNGFQLPWQVLGDRAVFSLDATAQRKNPMDPAQWPRESSGPTLDTAEHSTYVMARADVEADRPTLPFVASLQSHKPWHPWMLTGQAPGRIFTRTTARRSTGVAELSPAVRAYVERNLAAYVEPPSRWTGEYVTTFAIYQATHTPRKS